MTNYRKLAIFKREMIIGLSKSNHGTPDISEVLEIPRITCQNVINNFHKKGLTDVTAHSERLSLLSD
ncbi:9640_t:CDS:1, partial [Ambispora leptoticha]